MHSISVALIPVIPVIPAEKSSLKFLGEWSYTVCNKNELKIRIFDQLPWSIGKETTLAI